MIDPTLKKIAETKRTNKKVCRNCYARLPIRASNCRTCKSAKLRPKKRPKK